MLEFFYGIISTILTLAGLLIYGFNKLKQYAEVTEEQTIQRIQQRTNQRLTLANNSNNSSPNNSRKDGMGESVLAEEAAKLDPIKLSCHVRLMAFVSSTTAAAVDATERGGSNGGGVSPGQGPLGVTNSADIAGKQRAAPKHLHSGHYSNGAMGTAGVEDAPVVVDRQGRLVMLGTTIFVYETLSTVAGPSLTHATGPMGVVTSERLLGKISSSSIQFQIKEIGMDGVAGLARDRLDGSVDSLSSSKDAPVLNSSNATAGSGKDASNTEVHELLGVKVLVLTCRHDTSPSLFTPNTSLGSGSGGGSGNSSSGNAALLADCRRLILKFPTRRELDRWNNVLEATERSYEWRKFLRTLPSMDLFNLMTARIFFENNSGPALAEVIRKKIAKKLRHVNLPKPVSGKIRVANVKLGGEVPLVQNLSHASVSANGEIGFDFDVLYRGGFQVTFVADLFVRTLKVPQLLLYVTVLELGGRIHVSLGPPPSNKTWLGFHSPPNIRLEFFQETTSHEGVLSSLLSLLPDMSDLITRIVKVELFEDLLLPNLDDFPLPNVGDVSSSDDEDDHFVPGAAGVPDRLVMKDAADDFVLVSNQPSGSGKKGSSGRSTTPTPVVSGGGSPNPPAPSSGKPHLPSMTPPLRPTGPMGGPPPPLHDDDKIVFQSQGKSSVSGSSGGGTGTADERLGVGEGGLRRRHVHSASTGSAVSSVLPAVPATSSSAAVTIPKSSEDVRSVLMQKAMEVRRSNSNGRSAGTASSSSNQNTLQPQWNQPSF